MAPHPGLAYCEIFSPFYLAWVELCLVPLADLTGSLDGSVVMWEFGTPRAVATQREPGTGGSVTKIRFTPEGNKVCVRVLIMD